MASTWGSSWLNAWAASWDRVVVVQAGVGGLHGQFKPAIPRTPILVHFRVDSRVQLLFSVRSTYRSYRAVPERLHGVTVEQRSRVSVHRAARGANAVAVSTRGVTSTHRGQRDMVPLEIAPSSNKRFVREMAPSCVRAGVATSGVATYARASQSRVLLTQAQRSRVERVTRAKYEGRIGLGVCVRAQAGYSTLADRVEASDRRDVDLISLLAA